MDAGPQLRRVATVAGTDVTCLITDPNLSTECVKQTGGPTRCQRIITAFGTIKRDSAN